MRSGNYGLSKQKEEEKELEKSTIEGDGDRELDAQEWLSFTTNEQKESKRRGGGNSVTMRSAMEVEDDKMYDTEKLFASCTFST